MEFNVKFFLVAIVLSLVAEIFHHLNIWMLYVGRLPMDIYSWIVIALAPVQLIFGVVIPFAVMYILATRISSVVKSVIVSTFLGCWIGGVAVLAFHTYLMRGSYGYDSLFQLAFWTIWEIFAKALSAIFFVSLAAILFAHYQRTVNR